MPDKIEPFFSVIIPTYNRAAVLRNAIRSVIEQVFSNWELVVIDDGSTDDTKDIILEFKDNRIKYFYKKHEERSIARNYGIERSAGKYICFLDSDDIYFENHLSSIYSFLSDNLFPISFIHTELEVIQVDSVNHLNWFSGLTNKEVCLGIIKGLSLHTSAICIPRSLLENTKFPEKYSYWEDQHLWIRILIKNPFLSINKTTTRRIIVKESSVITAFQKDPFKKLREYLSCIRDLEQSEVVQQCNYIDSTAFEELKKRKISLFIKFAATENYLKNFMKFYFISLPHFSLFNATKFFMSQGILLIKTRKF